MRVIFYTMNDGSLALSGVSTPEGELLPATKAAAFALGLTDEEALNFVARRDAPKDKETGAPLSVGYRIGSSLELPGGQANGDYDATFREAFKDSGGIITIDMDKARAIHMGRIRVARDAAMSKLDVETLRGNDVQAQKQVLRDIPSTFDLSVATTPEELAALWPEELK